MAHASARWDAGSQIIITRVLARPTITRRARHQAQRDRAEMRTRAEANGGAASGQEQGAGRPKTRSRR